MNVLRWTSNYEFALPLKKVAEIGKMKGFIEVGI
jgi:hypothetical protein